MADETFDGGRGVDLLRLSETPDPESVTVTDTVNDREVSVTVRGKNVRRESGYFGRGRNRWQVNYRPKTQEQEMTDG
jgi:hypothetical protein